VREVLQVVQAVERGGRQRRVDAHRQLALRHVIAARQRDRLGDRARLGDHAARAHDFRRFVAVDRQQPVIPLAQRRLAGVGVRAAIPAGVEGQVDRFCVLDGHHPLEALAAAGRDFRRHVLGAVEGQARPLQRRLHGHRLAGVVVDHRHQRQRVAHDEEARRGRAHQQRLGADQVLRGLAHQGDAVPPVGHGAGVQPPGGQVIRQRDLDSGRAVLAGEHDRVPVRGIDELLPHLKDAAFPPTAAATLDRVQRGLGELVNAER